jgi:hypothetical protein
MKYYEWLDDCERSPGFAPSYYEFQENIEKSRRKRQEKKLREKTQRKKYCSSSTSNK